MNRFICSDIARCLSAYVDGELDPSHVLEIERHTDKCESCRARVAFARASRRSVRNFVKLDRPTESFRTNVIVAVSSAKQDAERSESRGAGHWAWAAAFPIAAVAAVILVWVHHAKTQNQGGVSTADATTSVAAISSDAPTAPVEDFVDSLIDQHANPLPPEATNPGDFAQFDRFVGVPVREVSARSWEGRLIGARVVPVAEQRAAMFQYVVGNGHRVSVYVYNPKRLRLKSSRRLRERIIQGDSVPVYTGYVRGYSVAVTDMRGVGYAMASDFDESESSKLLLAVGER